jgi:hypothetical protein
MKQWYYAKNGEQKGPVTENDLIILLQNNEIPLDSLIWSEGMSEWASAKDVGLAYAPPADEFHNGENTPSDNLTSSFIPMEHHDTGDDARDSINNSVNGEKEASSYGGFGRGAYFGWIIFLAILNAILAQIPGGILLAWVLVLFAGGQRYRNIGYNPWLILLALIPIVNLVIGYRCLAYPKGYADTKQVDTPMRVVSWLYGILIGLAILGIILAIVIPSFAG